jgi:opacity protein-like surface antigen
MFVFRGDYGMSEYWGIGFAGSAGYKTNFRSDDVNLIADPTGNTGYDTKDTLYTSAEVDLWYNRADWTFNAHVAYGSQKKAAITADPTTGDLRDATWYGASVLAAYKFTQRTEGVLRVDYISNQKNGGGLLDYNFADANNGIGPDQNGGDPEKGADRYAVTAGLNYAFNSNVTFKFEYRYDGATQNVFGNKDALAGGADPKYGKSNSLLGTAAVFSF